MAGFNNLPPTNDPANTAPAPGDLDPGVLEPQARWSLYLAAILANEALESSATSVYDFSQDRRTAGAVPVPENARGLLAAVATVARRRLAIASSEPPSIGIEAGLRDEELALTAASARFDFVARPRKNRAANTPLDAVAVTVRYVEGSETQGYGLTLDILIFSAHHP